MNRQTLATSSGTIKIIQQVRPFRVSGHNVHEMTHLLERNHGEGYTKLMDGCLPDWRVRRDQLNAAPLADEDWDHRKQAE